jgi:3-hydroxyisobutyrate dehydrogenase
LIDMSTVSPADSEIVAGACGRAKVDYLRAPVTGSTVLAAAGSLGTFASGPKHRYDEALPIFQVFGPRQFYLGPGDEARAMKLALNMLIGITMVGLAEGLLLAEKSGLDWSQVLEIYCNSAVGSPYVNYKAPPLAKRDFDPAFTTRGICKDFDLAIEAARDVGAASPLTVLSRQLFQATVDGGWGERDFSAVLMYLEKASGLEPNDSTAVPG